MGERQMPRTRSPCAMAHSATLPRVGGVDFRIADNAAAPDLAFGRLELRLD